MIKENAFTRYAPRGIDEAFDAVLEQLIGPFGKANPLTRGLFQNAYAVDEALRNVGPKKPTNYQRELQSNLTP